MLQSDKGLSSVRLAEAVGVSQPTAWRMGHALRLLVVRETPLGGTVEIDEFYLGGRPKPKADAPPPGRGRKGQRRTTKAPVLAVVQRPSSIAVGTPAGDARARVVDDLSAIEAERVLDEDVESEAHLMSDEWKAFIAVGQRFAAHDTVQHSRQEYVRGQVHANSAEGFNSRVRRTIRRLPSYESGTCRPLFPRDRFPMVPAHCHWTGHTTHSTWREIIKPIWCVSPRSMREASARGKGKRGKRGRTENDKPCAALNRRGPQQCPRQRPGGIDSLNLPISYTRYVVTKELIFVFCFT